MTGGSATNEQEWGDLIALTAAGDQEALAKLYDVSSPLVFGLALRVLGDREAAEEVTVDVYTQVWRRAATFDASRGTPGGWITTLARTRAIDRFRAGAGERGRRTPLDACAEVPGGTADPERYAVDLERQRAVQAALATVPPEQREPIAMAYYWGLSQREIADRLGLPLGTVKTRIRLGMLKLREALVPHAEGFVS